MATFLPWKRRLPSSMLASSVQVLAGPMPEMLRNSLGVNEESFSKGMALRSFLATSKTLSPFLPVHRSMAKSSTAESRPAPYLSSFSRGRSILGRSRMVRFWFFMLSSWCNRRKRLRNLTSKKSPDKMSGLIINVYIY